MGGTSPDGQLIDMPVIIVGVAPAGFKHSDIHEIGTGREVQAINDQPDGAAPFDLRHGDARGQRVRVEADGAVGLADRHREDGSRKGLSRVMPGFQFQVSRRGSTSDRGEGQPR